MRLFYENKSDVRRDYMLKMIIVDDESYAIDGLKKFIDWNSLGIEIVDTVPNGIEGLDKIRLHMPDIVITDIRMPLMGGIEMMKTLKSENLNVKIVVFSGYGEFEYAKESIRYGVIDYILKPSLPI